MLREPESFDLLEHLQDLLETLSAERILYALNSDLQLTKNKENPIINLLECKVEVYEYLHLYDYKKTNKKNGKPLAKHCNDIVKVQYWDRIATYKVIIKNDNPLEGEDCGTGCVLWKYTQPYKIYKLIQEDYCLVNTYVPDYLQTGFEPENLGETWSEGLYEESTVKEDEIMQEPDGFLDGRLII